MSGGTGEIKLRFNLRRMSESWNGESKFTSKWCLQTEAIVRKPLVKVNIVALEALKNLRQRQVEWVGKVVNYGHVWTSPIAALNGNVATGRGWMEAAPDKCLLLRSNALKSAKGGTVNTLAL